MERDKATAGKELKSIVAEADNSLKGFVELGASFGLKLDYSPNSLDEVEKLLVTFKTRPNFEELKSDAWLYIGQCVCKSFGAKWKVSNDVSHYRHHYMLPVIQGFSKFDDEYCPMLEINKFLADSKKSFFKNTIQSMQTGTYRYG
mgnify:CR=1 FL=1